MNKPNKTIQIKFVKKWKVTRKETWKIMVFRAIQDNSNMQVRSNYEEITRKEKYKEDRQENPN